MSVRLDIVDFQHELKTPLVTSGRTIASREGFELRVWDGETLLARGECAPLPGFSFEELEDCREEALLWQQDEGDIRDLELWRARATTVPHLPALRCAAETLVIELARLSERTLPYWPARERHRVRANALANTVEEAQQRVEAGFQVLKIKVGNLSLREDVQRVKAIRAAVGDTITLRLDANRAWSDLDARNAVDVFATQRIELLEEPLKNGGPRELAELRAYSTIPIGADEQARDQAAVLELIDEAAMDYLILKPMLVGGPLQCMRLAKLAHERGTHVIVTTTIDGPVATAMTIEVAARLPNDFAHGLATSVLFADASGFPPMRRGAYKAGERV